MYSFNYDYLEKLLIESKSNQKDLAISIGLPEKFFSRLDRNGNNLSFSDYCRIVEFFGISIDDLIVSKEKKNEIKKIDKGKAIFKKYFEYREKYMISQPPDPYSCLVSRMSDVQSRSSYISNPTQKFFEEKSEYKRIMEIYETMENVLTSIVCRTDIGNEEKTKLKERIAELLVYGVNAYTSQNKRKQLIECANKACVELVNQLEYKKVI